MHTFLHYNFQNFISSTEDLPYYDGAGIHTDGIPGMNVSQEL